MPPSQLGLAAVIGLGIGGVAQALDSFVFMPHQPEAIQVLAHAIPAWRGALASFAGGIGEEVVCRLLVMTLLAWVCCKALPRSAAMVTAAVVAALLFAAGHLPTAAQLAPLTSWVVVRVLVLNTVCGIAFGLLYWKRGLEHAMVAHFSADLVLHVLAA